VNRVVKSCSPVVAEELPGFGCIRAKCVPGFRLGSIRAIYFRSRLRRSDGRLRENAAREMLILSLEFEENLYCKQCPDCGHNIFYGKYGS